jgi:hypothetical protein
MTTAYIIDLLGNELKVGDQVVYVDKHAYSTYSELSTGHIVRFTPKMVEIEDRGKPEVVYGDKNYGHPKQLVDQKKVSLASTKQKVKDI